VRTVLVTQGYTKTSLFTGFHPGDGFINYALDPRTVGEGIVRAVLAGRSDHVVLPKGNAYIAALRFWPLWMQAHVRKDLKKMMKGFSGRMVEQPSEVPGLPGAMTGAGASPVTPKSMDGSAVIV
jgi:all-trans-retinol dehydrogenase (NAD+)